MMDLKHHISCDPIKTLNFIDTSSTAVQLHNPAVLCTAIMIPTPYSLHHIGVCGDQRYLVNAVE